MPSPQVRTSLAIWPLLPARPAHRPGSRDGASATAASPGAWRSKSEAQSEESQSSSTWGSRRPRQQASLRSVGLTQQPPRVSSEAKHASPAEEGRSDGVGTHPLRAAAHLRAGPASGYGTRRVSSVRRQGNNTRVVKQAGCSGGERTWSTRAEVGAMLKKQRRSDVRALAKCSLHASACFTPPPAGQAQAAPWGRMR